MVSWTALGGNPVPGDPAAVDRVAATFGAVRDEADVISNRLQGLREGTGPAIWRGQAADSFRDLMATLGPDLVKLSDSYHQAQEAMRGYSLSLSDAQYTARQAESDAENAITARDDANRRAHSAATDAGAADSQVRAAQQRLVSASVQANVSGALDPTYVAQMRQYMHDVELQKNAAQARANAARGREAAARSAAGAAAARLEAARRLAEQAKSLRDNAARTATRGLDAASQAGIRNRNVIFRTLSKIDAALRDLTASPAWARWMEGLSITGDILQIAGLCLMGVPIVGPVLFILGTVLKVISFRGTFIAWQYGHATTGEVVSRGIDLGLSLVPGAGLLLKTAKAVKVINSLKLASTNKLFDLAARGVLKNPAPFFRIGRDAGPVIRFIDDARTGFTLGRDIRELTDVFVDPRRPPADEPGLEQGIDGATDLLLETGKAVTR